MGRKNAAVKAPLVAKAEDDEEEPTHEVRYCPSRRVRTESLMDEPSGHRIERSSQLSGSQHDRITQLVIHQQQPDSHELLPVAALAPVRPNPAEGLASHSCEAGLSQGHPHIARYHTTTCQHCQLRRGTQPLRRAGDHGVQEIAQLKEEKRIRKLKRSIYLAFPLSLLVAAAFSQGFVDAQFTCIIIGMCYVAIRWNL
jgi:hypothetical protein